MYGRHFIISRPWPSAAVLGPVLQSVLVSRRLSLELASEPFVLGLNGLTNCDLAKTMFRLIYEITTVVFCVMTL